MKNNLKITLGALLISSSIFAIYGIKNISKETINSASTTDNKGSQISTKQDVASSEVVLQQLSILGNRCRGCGRCVRIDPEHFEMSGRVAVVISSNNLNSIALQSAINMCEGGAINLG